MSHYLALTRAIISKNLLNVILTGDGRAHFGANAHRVRRLSTQSN